MFARPANDVLIMKNGDRITCQVKGLKAGVLTVDLDYIDGSVSIDWLKVARIESDYLFIVTLQDGSIYSAKLISPETVGGSAVMLSIVPEDGQESRLVERSKVVRITQTSDSILQRFSGSISMGATYTKGNNATQYNFGSDLIYRRTRWDAAARFNSNLSANTGAATTTRNQLDLAADRMLSRTNYFLGGISTFLQSSVQGIHLQSTVGIGFGRYFKNTNRFRWWLLAGGGAQNTRYISSSVDQPSQRVGMALASSGVQAFAFKKTRFEMTSSVFPVLGSQKGRTYYKANATYYLKLFRRIDWNLSFYGNWDTRPPRTFSGSDYGSSTGVSWTFGDR